MQDELGINLQIVEIILSIRHIVYCDLPKDLQIVEIILSIRQSEKWKNS